MSVVCEMALPFVASSAADGGEVVRPLAGHVARCLRCQARAAAMRRTARELSLMSDERMNAPRDLEWRVMSLFEGDLAVPVSVRRPVRWVAAVLSISAAVLIWRLRPRTS